MNDKERADAMRREAEVFNQSDPTRAANLRRDADELDPQEEEFYTVIDFGPKLPAPKRAKPRKRGR